MKGIRVKLRQKKITGNRKSLYLDFYPPISHPETSKPTRREFLGYYIYEKPRNAVEKEHNHDTLLIAEQIRQKRDNQVNKPEVYTDYEKMQLQKKVRGEKSFVEYFGKLAEKRKDSNYDNWVSTYKHLRVFIKGDLKFSDINEKICEEFREYLLTAKSRKNKYSNLAQNSALSYFNKFKATLKQAFVEGYLETDINKRIDCISPGLTIPDFLTVEELNGLIKTPCKNPILKKASLFSALTGLRHCDILKLVWREIIYIEGNGYFIQFRQQKTDEPEMMPISEHACKLAGERKNPEDMVFEGLIYSYYQNKILNEWTIAAGITRRIKFHYFRHTYAVLQLSGGTDIYTVSKMLGHRDLKTTEIYAKVLDPAKRQATNKIMLDF